MMTGVGVALGAVGFVLSGNVLCSALGTAIGATFECCNPR